MERLKFQYEVNLLFSLYIKYYNLNGKVPHITYEYTVPRPSLEVTSTEDTTPSPSLSHHNFTHNGVNEDVRGDNLKATNCSKGSVTSVHPYNSQLGSDDQSDVQLQEETAEEGMWEIRTPSPLPPTAVLVYRPADVTSHVYNHNDVEDRGPPVPSGYRESEMDFLLFKSNNSVI